MTIGGSIQGVYQRLGLAGAVAVAAGTLGVVVVGMSLYSFTRAMLTTAPAVDPANKGSKSVETYKAQFNNYLAQIDGRTVFILPGAPKAKEPEPPPAPPPGPPPPPPKPTSYEGSAIMAMVMDTVWFENGTHLKVGDPEKDDTQVVEVNAPWDAKLKWKGEEFTVPFFGHDKVVIKKEDKPAAAPASASTPAPADAKPAATDKPAAPPATQPATQPATPPAPAPSSPRNDS